MARERLAPTLTRMVDAWVLRTQGTRSHKEARRELRNMEAVVRAAERLPDLRSACLGLEEVRGWDRMRRALKRLSAGRAPRGRK